MINNYEKFKSGLCSDTEFLKFQFIGENNPGTVTKYNILTKSHRKSYYFYVISRQNLINYDGNLYDEYKIIDLYHGATCLLKQKFYSNRKKISNDSFWRENNKNNPLIRSKISYYRDVL